MKVVLFSSGFRDYMIELANGLAEKTETVLMLPAAEGKERLLGLLHKKVTLELFPLYRQRDPRCIFMMRDVVRTIRKHDPDILHIQSNGHTWFFLAFPFLRKYPIVNTIHDPAPHSGEELRRKEFQMQNALKHSKAYIVHGEKLKLELVDRYPVIPNEKVHVIPHGSLSLYDKFTSEELPEEPNTILYFGRIWKYKGLDYLIKAEPLLRNKFPKIKIIIAGRGEPFDRYQEMIEEPKSFEIRNYRIPDEEVPGLFQRAAAVTLPYIDATQSGVLNLAYSFRKPVVVTNVGALPEAVDDGVTGFIVPPKDEHALAEAITCLLENAELRKKMGEDAYRKGRTDLSWDRITDITLSLYQRVS